MAKASSIQLPKEILEQIYAEVEARIERKFRSEIAELKQRLNSLQEESDAWKKRYFAEQARARGLQGKLELAQVKIKELEKLVEKQRVQIEQLQQQVHGKKNETTPAPIPVTEPKRSRGRQIGAPGHGRQRRDNIEPVQCVHDFTPEERQCARCGLPYEDFSEKTSEEIHFEYKLIRRIHRRKIVRKTCKCPGVPAMKTAPGPAKLFTGSLLSVDTWAYIMYDKYHLQRPLNRVRKWLESLGLTISQGTLTNGLKRLHERNVFKPLYDEIFQRVSASRHQQKDETGWKVFQKMEGKKGYGWYLWVTLGNDCCLFEIEQSRSRAVAKHTIGTDPVVLTTDCLSSYHNMGDNVTNSWCWAHIRRALFELKRFPKLSSLSRSWVNKVNNLYHLNKLRLAAPPEEFDIHNAKLKTAVAEFERQAKRNAKRPGMHEEASLVFRSIARHWQGLTVFVRMPAIPMDNNASERAIRGPICGRKAYYGSGSHWSAGLSAQLFTIMTTLEHNGIEPRDWLTEYLQAVARNGGNAPANATSYLPWNTPPANL